MITRRHAVNPGKRSFGRSREHEPASTAERPEIVTRGRASGCKDHLVNDWLRARNGWILLLIYWAVALAAALLGTATAMILWHGPAASFASNLPWVIGGTLFMALVCTGGTLRRRRQAG